ncbi:MAG: hypothetical protein KDK35_16170 [Leptospiraceae bacterium]|nr:hypothetical protein [Leptospiraceae bacterium]
MFLFATAGLRAQTGFYDGRLLLEIKGVGGVSYGGAAYSDIRNLYEPDLPFFTLLAGTDTQKLQALYTRQRSEPPDVQSYGGEFALEYAVLDWLGLGFDLHGEVYRVTNVRSIDASSATVSLLPYASVLASSGAGSLNSLFINLEIIDPLLTNTVELIKIYTLDFNIAFHFLDRSTVDPYFRLVVGAGQETELKITAVRLGGTLGARFFLGDTFYLLLEANGSRYFLTGKSEETADQQVDDHLDEGTINAGFGVAF